MVTLTRDERHDYGGREWRTRHWGRRDFWHDGPHVVFGLWWFDVSWSTYWTVSRDEPLT